MTEMYGTIALFKQGGQNLQSHTLQSEVLSVTLTVLPTFESAQGSTETPICQVHIDVESMIVRRVYWQFLLPHCWCLSCDHQSDMSGNSELCRVKRFMMVSMHDKCTVVLILCSSRELEPFPADIGWQAGSPVSPMLIYRDRQLFTSVGNLQSPINQAVHFFFFF